MPWSIERRGDEWCVIKDDDGEVEGCFDTEDEARDQQKALYADEPDAGVENAGATVGTESSIEERLAAIEARMSGAAFVQGLIEGLAAGDAPEQATPESTPAGARAWRGVLAMEGATDDGRFFEEVDWRQLPLSLMCQVATAMGPHEGAQVCGRIDWMERRGRAIIGGGVYNDDEFGQYAAARLEDRSLTGVSVDAVGMGEFRCTEYDTSDPAWPLCLDVVLVFGQATICAATQLAAPAFAAATLELVPDGETPEEAASALVRLQAAGEALLPPDPTFVEAPPMMDEPLLAAAGRPTEIHPPVEPSRAWFEVEEPGEYTRLHITAEGQLLGHVAPWHECHTGYPGACVTAPPSPSAYALFNLGTVVCDDGTAVRTGPVTLTTSHADEHLDVARTLNHYDNSGCAIGDVVVREGALGPWACGAARPTITPEQIREFHASAPSGDWRPIRGQLDLVAVLMVNTPGFPPLLAAGVRALEDGSYVQDSLILASLPDGARVATPTGRLEARIAELEGRLTRAELIINAVFEELEPRLFETLRASIEQS